MNAYDLSGDRRPDDDASRLPTYCIPVDPAWIDGNRHMNAAFYLAIVKDPAIAVHNDWDYGEDFRARTGESNFVVRSEVAHVSELHLCDEIVVATRLWALDRKRLRLLFEIRNGTRNRLAAVAQYVIIHVALGPPPRVRPIPDALYDRLLAVRDDHAAVPVPPEAARLYGGDKPRPAGWPADDTL